MNCVLAGDTSKAKYKVYVSVQRKRRGSVRTLMAMSLSARRFLGKDTSHFFFKLWDIKVKQSLNTFRISGGRMKEVLKFQVFEKLPWFHFNSLGAVIRCSFVSTRCSLLMSMSNKAFALRFWRTTECTPLQVWSMRAPRLLTVGGVEAHTVLVDRFVLAYEKKKKSCFHTAAAAGKVHQVDFPKCVYVIRGGEDRGQCPQAHQDLASIKHFLTPSEGKINLLYLRWRSVKCTQS